MGPNATAEVSHPGRIVAAVRKRTVIVLKRPRGRPPRPMPDRPTCPDGHPGRVILWGRRRWTCAPYRRQRARCLPGDRSRPYTFSLDRRQTTPDHPAGESCPACDVTPTASQGPSSPVAYLHIERGAQLGRANGLPKEVADEGEALIVGSTSCGRRSRVDLLAERCDVGGQRIAIRVVQALRSGLDR